jgi:Secretion system C-terminal sorting domain
MEVFSKIAGKKAGLILILLQGLLCGSHMAQTTIVLQMEQMLGGQPFAYQHTTKAELGYYFTITRLQYYVSEITLIHDGGQKTLVPDYYLLIDPSKDSVFELGNFPVTDLEQIEFWIGVDSAHNHLDPAVYPVNHPLAPQNPSMHWGWAGGYRFMALEGFAGHTPSYIPNNYQIHTIADENYRKVSLTVNEVLEGDSMYVPIRADYAFLLRRIDVSRGLEFHSSFGPSKQISINTRDVFATDILSSSSQPETKTHLHIFPNPAADFFTITLPWSPKGPLTLTMMNLQGKRILNETIYATDQTIELNTDLVPGMYIVMLSDGQQSFFSEKIVVSP